jgi:voltage-gated potassium channel Kch
LSALLKKIATILSSKSIGFAALFVLFAGIIGYLVDDTATAPAVLDFGAMTRLLVYAFIKALKLFSLSLPDAGVTENWLLVVARLVGSLVAMAAIFKLIITVFRQDVTTFIASLYRDHTVILGYGARNARFTAAITSHNPKKSLIVVDKDPEKSKLLIAPARGLFFQSDLSLNGAMAPANIRRADLILIGTGSDERNLALARAVNKARPETGNPGAIIVTIDDPGLAERCSRDPDIARPANGDELFVFNPATLAARSLLGRTPFSDLALAAGQNHVHLIIAGFSETAQEILIQFLRISACSGLGRPRIDIIAPDRQAALHQLFERAPNLAHAVSDAQTQSADTDPLAWAVDLRVHSGSPTGLCHDPAVIAATHTGGDPTAIIVATGDTIENVKIGLAFKLTTRMTGRLRAPVYIRMAARSSLEDLLLRYDGGAPKPPIGPLASMRGTTEIAEAIEPFGSLDDICSMDALTGQRESLARQLHEAYRAKRRSDTTGSDQGDPGLESWSLLNETYRQANRRSADHLAVKLLSIGEPHWWDSGRIASLATATEDCKKLEELARLEHVSWRIDRELDGWRYATTRDNDRLLHPDLVDYAALSERSKDYDREMIRVAANMKPLVTTIPADGARHP